jgi:hypothetical protein
MASIGCAHEGSLRNGIVCVVSISPGEMTFALMPCLRPSMASWRVMAITAPFAAACDGAADRTHVDDRRVARLFEMWSCSASQ